ncbi:MAG: discoidin domain-containing protein [Anaerolineae bacterium]|nr:discoidin domain-containing protein [Anaerolineae bacterium]
MKQISVFFATIATVLLAFALVNAQEDTCPGLIYEAIMQTSDLCDTTARNEACYGHQNVDVTLREDGTNFAAPGDIAALESIDTIHTLPLDDALQQFGIVLLRAQADLPNLIPGQNVTMLLMGDVTVQDQSTEAEGIRPMQAFLFTPGIGTSRCEELDYNTIAIQSPENVTVNLTINGASIELGSTAVIVGDDSVMDMLIVEGQGTFSTDSGSQIVAAGQWSQVALEDGMAVGAPADPTEFPAERIAHLPLELLNAGRNLALGKPVTASNALATDPAERVVDGEVSGNFNWNAGDFPPPQWIEVDLEREYPVASIRMLTSQYPEDQLDPTVHQVYVAGEDHNLRLAHTFSQETRDNQWLEFTPDTPLDGVRFVRVLTTSTIHWVSWGEIEVIGAGFQGCIVHADNTVNLRVSASTDAEQVGSMTAGQSRTVTGKTEASDGFTWWQLDANTWVREDVVREEGNCDRVPVVMGE